MTEDISKIVSEIRGLVESKTATFSDTKEKVEKMSEKLVELSEENQSLTIAKVNSENDLKEIKEKQETMEKTLCRMPAANSTKNSAHRLEFKDFFLNSDLQTPLTTKYLRTDVNTDGGYLVPIEFVREIYKKLTEVSPIRQLARVRPAASKAMEIPVRSTLVTGGWAGEAKTLVTSNSTYGLTSIPLRKLGINVPITIEELQDAAFDMSEEINSDVIESFQQIEGQAFVNGNSAINEPEGFMVAAGTSEITSAAVGVIDFDDMFDLIGQVKAGYNPVFMFNILTLVNLMKEKSTTGSYLWSGGNTSKGVPATIAGFPYVIVPDMDNIATNAHPVAFADLRRGYLIGDRVNMTMIKDIYSRKNEGMVEFSYMKRTGGGVVLPETIAKLKVQ